MHIGFAAHASTTVLPTIFKLCGEPWQRYRKNPGGGCDHSNVVAVLNPEGEVVYRLEGPNQPVAPTVQHLR